MTVTASHPNGANKTFTVSVRLDTPVEVEYYRNGGILHTVLRQLATSQSRYLEMELNGVETVASGDVRFTFRSDETDVNVIIEGKSMGRKYR